MVKSKILNPVMSKSNNVFASSVSVGFGGKGDLFKRGFKAVKRTPVMTRLKAAFVKRGGQLLNFLKKSADDIFKPKSIKMFFSKALKNVKKGVALIAAGITSAVVFVRSIGDDIKIRMRAKIHPVKFVKDVSARVFTKGKNHIAQMNNANYASMSRMEGPGVNDVVEQVGKGVSGAAGVDLGGSAKAFIVTTFKKMFG